MGEMRPKCTPGARSGNCDDGHERARLMLSNWEATGFDFDFKRIAGLYETAKQVARKVLLDDGWFGNKYPRSER